MSTIISVVIIMVGLLFQVQNQDTSATLHGQLIDSETGVGIEYVNIGIQNTPVGCISGMNGFFSLVLDPSKYLDSSIRISAIGYEHAQLDIAHTHLKDSVTIHLKPVIYQIDEIIIEGKQLKLKNYGIKRGGDGFIKGMLHGLEKAYLVPVKKEKIKIRDVNFCLRSEFDTVTFRINFYNSENDAPNERINTENLIFSQVSDENGWIECDLSNWQLKFDSDFFVAVELLPELNNNMEVRSVFKAKLGARGKLFSRDYLDSWMEFKGIGIPINVNYYQMEHLQLEQ